MHAVLMLYSGPWPITPEILLCMIINVDTLIDPKIFGYNQTHEQQ